ncbi:LuxR C-terminal-related transcriptional regulator [Lysinibacillus sp. G4S2]|uniref:response regulator transcription factor n=1 Tax=Lysinibacillus sp. G4S2 TaxID=3055859 RepID=UPI0025A10A9B|nr:LuxR C-terminal-related transcriptional regulator [Lysinibacillus sp. G4S2]MDM5247879.1 LuxR C-terminal-related transcriptional regulator [Lysinibacillus sp. G4S2]
MYEQKEVGNLLEATIRISNMNMQQTSRDFKLNMLQVLSECFQFEHTLFWEVADGELNEQPVCFNVETYTIQNYLHEYKYYDPLHPVNMQNQPDIQLMQRNEAISKKKKRYYVERFLQLNDFIDEMVMYLYNQQKPTAAIGFLRKEGEKPFTEQDSQKLSYIKRMIENAYLLHQYVQPSESWQITQREKELLMYLCKGFKNGEIASCLYVSENTVKKHLQNLYRKFKVTSRTQLALKYAESLRA